MAPRKYVHMLLILSELIIIACCLLMIIKYDRTDWNRKIWMGSKILTLKKVLSKNKNETYPMNDFISSGDITNYSYNYEELLKHATVNDCENNYKPCGILDTCGNIMCIP